MLRLLYLLLIGIVGAGIVHIAVLLLLPQFSERDAWSSLTEAADIYKAVRIDGGDGSPPIVKAVSPLFHAAGCRFDLDEGPVHVRTPGTVPFWSVSIYNRAGQNVYSFNDRATDNGALDFVVLTSAQRIEVRKAVPEKFKNSTFIEAPISEGIVVVRSFVPDQTWEESTSEFLARIACTKE